MPIYEYICSACDHRADILHGINDPGPHFCPSCGGEATMRKLFAPPTIHYKGAGWARKDRAGSRAAGSKAADPGDGAGTSKPAASDGGESSAKSSAESASSAAAGGSSDAGASGGPGG